MRRIRFGRSYRVVSFTSIMDLIYLFLIFLPTGIVETSLVGNANFSSQTNGSSKFETLTTLSSNDSENDTVTPNTPTLTSSTSEAPALCQKVCDSQKENRCCGKNERNLKPINATEDLCYQQLDGNYPDYNYHCKKYTICQGGQTVASVHCPDGESFSYHEQKCVVEYLMSCVKPVCHPETKEFFLLPGSLCQSYYLCQQGVALQFNCPDGKVFNRETQDCVKGGLCYEPLCTGKTDGPHPDTTQECSRLLHCRAGRLRQVTTCPPRQKASGRSCHPSTQQQECQPPETTSISVEKVHDDCRGYPDGPHVIPATDCRRYQICRDGKSHYKLTCPKSQKFNGDECTPQEQVTCQDICSDKNDGFHPDKSEGCRKYNFCRGRKLVQRFSCPDGSLFSGQMCLPAPLVTCDEPKTIPNNPCTGLPDGFHGDYMNECTRYYYCTSNKVILNTTCTERMTWNGQNCEEKEYQICDKPRTHKDCHGLPTGLYQDTNSYCKKYMYCHEGRKVQLSCLADDVFDGEKCTSNTFYTCPSMEANSCFKKQNGYHTDEESGCRTYYHCSNGHKTIYVCPEKKIFNGTTCVDSTDFVCENTYSVCNKKKNGYFQDLTSNCRKYYYCEAGNKLNTFDCGPRKSFDGTRCVLTADMDHVCGIVANS